MKQKYALCRLNIYLLTSPNGLCSVNLQLDTVFQVLNCHKCYCQLIVHLRECGCRQQPGHVTFGPEGLCEHGTLCGIRLALLAGFVAVMTSPLQRIQVLLMHYRLFFICNPAWETLAIRGYIFVNCYHPTAWLYGDMLTMYQMYLFLVQLST